MRAESVPERLADLLSLWRYNTPWFHEELDRVEEVFPAASYQYVLYGMGFASQVQPGTLDRDAKLAERAFRENAARTQKLRTTLPTHRDLIRRIVTHGMQAI